MKKLLSVLLAVCTLLCTVPLCAAAAETDTEAVTFTALDGNGSNTDNESYEKLVDGDKSTKWFSNYSTGLYIIIKASRSVAVNGYTFTTGNDSGGAGSGRNPKNWVLYGCNDYDEGTKSGGNWTALHTVTDDTTMENKNTTDYDFSFTNSAEYLYYKLEITGGTEKGEMQLSEMVLHLAENDWYASADGKKLTLGTDEILNPVSGSWQHLYFGNYNGSPIDFRILSKSISDFGGKTMLLENAEYLLTKPFTDSSYSNGGTRLWKDSTLRAYLNGDFFTAAFESGEQAAIHSSTKSSISSSDYNGTIDEDYKFASLTGDKVFLLDFREYGSKVYGFDDLSINSTNIYKLFTNIYKSETGKTYLTRSFHLKKNSQIIVLPNGASQIQFSHMNTAACVSPALNIKLSSVLFTKNVSGHPSSYNAYHKLSLLTDSISAAVNGNAVKTGNTIDIPYSVTGEDATQLSVMILDKAYTAGNTNGAKIKYYGKAADVTTSKSGSLSFEVPSEFSAQTAGKDYFIYLVAEDINGEKETDYAGTPVLVTPKDKYAVTYKPGKDGKGDAKTVYKIEGIELTLENVLFTRTGYTQIGWALTDGGEKTYGLGAEYTADAPLTLYPVWEEADYTINITYSGVLNGTTAAVSGKWGSSVLNNFTLPGYDDGTHTLKCLELSYYDSTAKKNVPITAETTIGDIIKRKANYTFSVTVTPKWEYTATDADGLLWAAENRIYRIVLGKDFAVSENVEFIGASDDSSIPETVLDLNGYVLSGTASIALSKYNLILTDSRPNAQHSDKTLPNGGVIGDGVEIILFLNGKKVKSTLYANGGTVLGDVSLREPLYNFIESSAETMTVFGGNVTAERSDMINGGIYLKKVTVNKVTDGTEIFYVTKGIFYGGLSDERCVPNSAFRLSFDMVDESTKIPDQVFVGVESFKALEPELSEVSGAEITGWRNVANNIFFDFEEDEITVDTVLSPVTEITVTNEAELKTAVSGGVYSIVLGADFPLTENLKFVDGTKYFDLNGHVFGSITDIKLKLNAELTVLDSNSEAPHAIAALPAGGIIAGEKIELCADNDYSATTLNINGGTILSDITVAVGVYLYSDASTVTKFKGKVVNYGTIEGGRYFRTVENHGTICKGSFLSGITNAAATEECKPEIVGNKFTVRFDTDGGSEISPQVYVHMYTEKVFEPAAPTKSGFKFAGWLKNDSEFDFNYTVRGNLTLKATWVVPGDANGDGEVNILDLVRMKKYTSGTAKTTRATKTAADMNDSGSLDSLDLTLLRKLLLGILS